MEKLGLAIEITTVFFILSLISERFITWFKLYFFKKGNTLFGYFFNWKEDYSKKTGDPEFEKEREQRILLLNISLSIIIATLVHANLFGILSKDPTGSLGWTKFVNSDKLDPVKWKLFKGYLFEIIGCIFAGLLMSLGSKFWHDTLDMLFYAKNLKNKLAEKETYKMNTLKELDEWISITAADMLKKVYDENLAVLKNIPGVLSVGIGHNDDLQYIEVTISDNNIDKIPKSLPYYLPNNAVKKIEVRTVISSEIVTHVNLGFKSDITNQNRTDNFGSYGLAVKFKTGNKTPMLLTCYHVVIGEDDDYNHIDNTLNQVIISPHDDTGSQIGTVKNAIRNKYIDAAIVSIDDSIAISNQLPDKSEIKKIRKIMPGEVFTNISARIHGCKSELGGKIKSINNYASITYTLPNGEKEKWSLYGLIAVSNSGKAISVEGDSGAALIDAENNVIGMIVAGNKELSYAIPIETIFNQLNIELI